VAPESRLQQITSDLFWSCAEGELSYAQMQSAKVIACPAAALPSDAILVRPVATAAKLIDMHFLKHFGVPVRALERFERYLRVAQSAVLDAGGCLSHAIGDILHELHLVPNAFLTSLSELLRWLRGEITLAVAAVRAGVRWALKAVALWGVLPVIPSAR